MKWHIVCESSNGCARLITSLSYWILCFAFLVLELWTGLKNVLSKEISSSGWASPIQDCPVSWCWKVKPVFLVSLFQLPFQGNCVVATLHSSILFLPVTLPEITLDPLPFNSSNCSVSNNFGTTGKIKVFDKLIKSLQQDSSYNARDITKRSLRQLLIF